MKYTGKVVLISGGSGGYGIAFGRALLERGSKVCLADIVEGKEVAELQKKFGKTKVLFSKCDVTQDEDFENAFKICEEVLGPVDILINTAGIFSEQNPDLTLAVNLRGVIRGTELALKKMGKNNGGKGGHVINMSSITGIFQFGLGPFYAATKGAIVQYSRSLGDDMHFEYNGVVVQCICPSYSNTPMVMAVSRPNSNAHYNEVTEMAWAKQAPNEPLLQPVEVANALLKLIEDEKRGTVMVVEYNKEPYYAQLLDRIV